MNKQYICKDDKVIVSNEEGLLREIPNYNNLEEILEQENIIDNIEKEINRLIILRDNPKPLSKHFQKGIKYALLILVPVIIELLSKGLHFPIATYETPIGIMSVTSAMELCIAVGLIIGEAINMYRDNKEQTERDNTKKGLEASINYLNKVLNKEYIKLNKLNKENNVTYDNDFEVGTIKIHDPKYLSEIDNYKMVNYKVCSNIKKYYKHYLSGTLHFLLEKENDINNFDNYYDVIEEEGPKLIKNFRHTDMY